MKVKFFISGLFIIAMFNYCNRKEKGVESVDNLKDAFVKGQFGFDYEFLNNYKEVIVLKSKDGQAQLIVCPEYQGRVMTSTAEGPEGYSFGWINHDLIASGEILEHFNPVGGEDRFWLGPEGGQFSLYFKPQSGEDFSDWNVPKEIDTEPFTTVSINSKEVVFQKDMTLRNYSSTEFRLNVERTIRILEKEQISDNLNVTVPAGIAQVGFESENVLTNIGENTWDKDSGMPSIWILSMLQASTETTIVVPFKKGDESELGKIVTDDYFGKVPAERLVVNESILFFKADGNKRSKIGISPKRVLPIAGSYDREKEILSIIQFTLTENVTDYVNSSSGIQDNPFEGDVMNAYNDGPHEDGNQFGKFYELESSSPAAALQSGESLRHVHRMYHFKGEKKDLDSLATALLGVDIDTILSALN